MVKKSNQQLKIKNNNLTRYYILRIVFGIGIALVFLGITILFKEFTQPKATKIYWFIPDGMRAEENVFTVFQWAQEGKLPNIKKLIENGSYGYSIPDFPSHTPTNFASLLTGAHPSIHGVADGPMHIEGYPLDKPSVAGFSSTAKKVSPIWKVLEDSGKKVTLLSIPGSTPPELKNGITIRGRWGGWGEDTHAIIYEPLEKLQERKSQGRGFRLFYLGMPLTRFTEKSVATGWNNAPVSYTSPYEATLNAYGTNLHAYIFDSTNDTLTNFDSVLISKDKNTHITTLKPGSWSDWYPVTLHTTKDNKVFKSQVKIKVIKLSSDGVFRVRLYFNNINEFIADPPYVAKELTEGVGPMVDFVDNWPAQLIYEDEDKATFLEEMQMSLDWHKKATGFIYEKYQPDVFIQDTYTPNQMLESRWWHRYIDTDNKDYTPEGAKTAMVDILKMYQGLDAILGEAMQKADKNTLIVLSSDHGIAGLHKQVKLNNLFAQKGWFRFTTDRATGEPIIDWANTKVAFLKMAHVYINPNGLGGNWKRGSGTEYEKLREEVINTLQNELIDQDGSKVLIQAVKWEDAPKFFDLPTDRVGDIVLEVQKGYQWLEEPDETLSIFVEPLTSGYKQANNPKDPDMWTPFVIMGPGVKKGYKLENPISHVDQMPTFLKLLNIKIPEYVQGRVLTEILSK